VKLLGGGFSAFPSGRKMYLHESLSPEILLVLLKIGVRFVAPDAVRFPTLKLETPTAASVLKEISTSVDPAQVAASLNSHERLLLRQFFISDSVVSSYFQNGFETSRSFLCRFPFWQTVQPDTEHEAPFLSLREPAEFYVPAELMPSIPLPMVLALAPSELHCATNLGVKGKGTMAAICRYLLDSNVVAFDDYVIALFTNLMPLRVADLSEYFAGTPFLLCADGKRRYHGSLFNPLSNSLAVQLLADDAKFFPNDQYRTIADNIGRWKSFKSDLDKADICYLAKKIGANKDGIKAFLLAKYLDANMNRLVDSLWTQLADIAWIPSSNGNYVKADEICYHDDVIHEARFEHLADDLNVAPLEFPIAVGTSPFTCP